MNQRSWIALWWRNPQELLPWVDFLSQYTPQIYVRNKQSIVFEIGRSHRIIDKNCLKVKMMAMDGLTPPSIGDAACPAEALAMAQFAVSQPSELPLEALAYFVEPFRESNENLKPLKKILTDLKSLGLSRLAHFMTLSERDVGARWSHWGKRLWLSVHGAVTFCEPMVETKERFSESYDFPEEAYATQLEPLYFIGKQLLQRLQAKLSQKNLGAQALKVILTGTTFDQDFCGSLEFELRLPAFHNEVSLWLNLLRERLQVLAREQKLPELLERFELVVEQTLSWQGLQRDLLDPHREHREGALLEALTKIEGRLGGDKIFCAEPRESYRPERSWKRRPVREWYEVITQKKRPLKQSGKDSFAIYELLSQKPLRVLAEPQRLLSREKQILFNNRWEQCRVMWSEIVSGEFWDSPFERRYGVGYLNSGERIWVYKEGEHLYLQGFFL